MQTGYVFAPEIITPRFVDGVILAVAILDGEAAGEGLMVVRLRVGGRVRLAGHALRLEAGHEFGSRKRQQIAQFGRVQKIWGTEDVLMAAAQAADRYAVHAIPARIRSNGLMLQ